MSHQKLADQVAQRAIYNYNAQKDRRQFQEPEGPKFGDNATSRAPEQQQPVSSPSSTHAQNYDVTMVNQQTNPPINIVRSRDQSRDRATKSGPSNNNNGDDDATRWIVQESVSANQLVKGAPWARYKIDKQNRVWPPPEPKMVPVEPRNYLQKEAEYAANVVVHNTSNNNRYQEPTYVQNQYAYSKPDGYGISMGRQEVNVEIQRSPGQQQRAPSPYNRNLEPAQRYMLLVIGKRFQTLMNLFVQV